MNMRLPPMARCNCVDRKPGCCFIQLASFSQAAISAGMSASATVNRLTSTTGVGRGLQLPLDGAGGVQRAKVQHGVSPVVVVDACTLGSCAPRA